MNSKEISEIVEGICKAMEDEASASTKAAAASTKAANGIKVAIWSFTGFAMVIGYFALEVRNATLNNASLINELDKRVIVVERDVETILKQTGFK